MSENDKPDLVESTNGGHEIYVEIGEDAFPIDFKAGILFIFIETPEDFLALEEGLKKGSKEKLDAYYCLTIIAGISSDTYEGLNPGTPVILKHSIRYPNSQITSPETMYLTTVDEILERRNRLREELRAKSLPAE